jgi:hypothetical protein
MARSIHETWHVRQPDFIPEGEEYKYPHLGGIFHDFVPEGEKAIDMHGLTYDATPPAEEHLETILVKEPKSDTEPNSAGTKADTSQARKTKGQ